MPKIINAFRGTDPLAQTLAEMGQRMWGDRLTPELKRQQLYAAQRENTELDNLTARIASGGGAQALGADPTTQAFIVASGYKPDDFAALGRLGAATQYGAADPRTDNFVVGSGGSYGSTAGAFAQDLAEKGRQADAKLREESRQFDMLPKPVLGPQGPQFVPQGQMTQPDFQPILSDAERKGTLAGQNFGQMGQLPINEQTYLGADPASAPNRTPRNYIGPDRRTYVTYDGVTDAQSGKPLPTGGALVGLEDTMQGAGLTNSTLSGVQQDQLSLQRFNGLVDMAIELTNDPTLFGPVGKLRSYGQELTQTFGAVGQLFGADTDSAIRAAQADLAKNGVDPALLPELFTYDPNVPKVETIWGLLAYQGASALAGQEGRSVSDNDMRLMRRLLGDPQSFFSSAIEARSRLQAAREIANLYSGFNAQALGGQPLPGGAPQAPSPAPAMQPPAAQPVVRFERGPDGVLRRVAQ